MISRVRLARVRQVRDFRQGIGDLLAQPSGRRPRWLEFLSKTRVRPAGTFDEIDRGVTQFRATLTALLLLVAMMATTASVFATPRHTACVTQKHECEHVPTIAECCCQKAESGRPDSTPPEPRIAADASALLATPVIAALAAPLPQAPALTQPIAVSPRFATLDLPILFSTFLI